jgi:hypothetical protein
MNHDIPSTNSIKMFSHCKRCVSELPEGESAQSYARLEVGFTDLGVQVWCLRHNINVMHIDFEGRKHPANLKANDA